MTPEQIAAGSCGQSADPRGPSLTMGLSPDRAGLVARIAELEKLAITLHGSLAAHTAYGCPACPGDCSSANPPMMFCPTAQAQAAYFMFDRAALKDTRHDADA